MYIGAGGEGPKEDTIFDDSIKNMGEYTKQSPETHIDIALNGGHSKTEAIIKESFPTATTKSGFLESDYLRLIQNYKSMLENNVMIKGDQLLIYINSHGAKTENEFKTHQIATAEGSSTNLLTLEGAKLVDLDQLEILKRLAKDKGIKLAIVDTSCHSGATLALADDNTCVISSTSSNLYSYFNFSPNFTAAMKQGKNLEEIFLEIRENDDSPALPMISTQAGREANFLIEEKITPFFYYFDETQDKLTPFLRENNSDYHQCMADENYNSLIQTIHSIEKMNSDSTKILWWTIKTKKVDLSNLKELLEEYKKSLDFLRLKSKELQIQRLNQEENFNLRAATYPMSSNRTYTWKELITTDFNKLISQMQIRITNETDRFSLIDKQGVMSLYVQAKAKKDELLKTQPDLAGLLDKEDEMKRMVESNYSISAKIAIEERILYSALYKDSQKKQSVTQSNPCKDFKL